MGVMRLMQVYCCKGCKERTIGCHSICIDYLIEKDKNYKYNDERLKIVEVSRWTNSYTKKKLEVLIAKKKRF